MDQNSKWIKIQNGLKTQMDQNQRNGSKSENVKDTDNVVDVILSVPYDGIEHY